MDVAAATLLVLALGGLGAAVTYAQVKVMRDGPSQLGQHRPGAQRRALLACVSFAVVLACEVGLFVVGRAASGPALGGVLAVSGLVVVLTLGFVLAARDAASRRLDDAP